jgi:PTH1 family peptidyl-tRNA hydrolase
MRLIVGLGNPGREYHLTPHNLGFLTVDRIAEQAGIRVSRPEGGAEVGLGKLAGEEIVLAKPLSYMNLSGGPVKVLLG